MTSSGWIGVGLLVLGTGALFAGCAGCSYGLATYDPPHPEFGQTVGAGESRTQRLDFLHGEKSFSLDVESSTGTHARCRLELRREDGTVLRSDDSHGEHAAHCGFDATVGPGLLLTYAAPGDAGGPVVARATTPAGASDAVFLIPPALIALVVGFTLFRAGRAHPG